MIARVQMAEVHKRHRRRGRFARVEVLEQTGRQVRARVLDGDGMPAGSVGTFDRADVYATAAELVWIWAYAEHRQAGRPWAFEVELARPEPIDLGAERQCSLDWGRK